ncbi:MAG: hypothetical protein ACMG6E_10480 [Candidatus Roizmanbacteria bacterium]
MLVVLYFALGATNIKSILMCLKLLTRCIVQINDDEQATEIMMEQLKLKASMMK